MDGTTSADCHAVFSRCHTWLDSPSPSRPKHLLISCPQWLPSYVRCRSGQANPMSKLKEALTNQTPLQCWSGHANSINRIAKLPAGLNRIRNLTGAPKQIDVSCQAKTHASSLIHWNPYAHTWAHHLWAMHHRALGCLRGPGDGLWASQWASARHRGALRGGPGGPMAWGRLGY